MAKAAQVLDVAKSQIGYKEGKNNWTKYGEEYGMNNCSWCMIFVWWVFKHAGAEGLIKKTASCTAEWNAMKYQAVARSALRPGDIVFFDWDHSGDCDHVGIVESAGSSGSQSNGDGVYRRKRQLTQVAKAVRPKYEQEAGGTCEVTVKELQKGSTGNTVRALQTLLRHRFNYNLTIDGDFGPTTEARVKAFQKAHGLSQDGLVGKKTWEKLLSA